MKIRFDLFFFVAAALTVFCAVKWFDIRSYKASRKFGRLAILFAVLAIICLVGAFLLVPTH